MGYRIDYGSGKKTGGRRKKLRVGLIAAICLCLLVAVLEISGLKTMLWNRLLPGDPAVTAAALDEMVQAIRSGESAAGAVTAFCMEIVENARTSP